MVIRGWVALIYPMGGIIIISLERGHKVCYLSYVWLEILNTILLACVIVCFSRGSTRKILVNHVSSVGGFFN